MCSINRWITKAVCHVTYLIYNDVRLYLMPTVRSAAAFRPKTRLEDLHCQFLKKSKGGRTANGEFAYLLRGNPAKGYRYFLLIQISSWNQSYFNPRFTTSGMVQIHLKGKAVTIPWNQEDFFSAEKSKRALKWKRRIGSSFSIKETGTSLAIQLSGRTLRNIFWKITQSIYYTVLKII